MTDDADPDDQTRLRLWSDIDHLMDGIDMGIAMPVLIDIVAGALVLGSRGDVDEFTRLLKQFSEGVRVTALVKIAEAVVEGQRATKQ